MGTANALDVAQQANVTLVGAAACPGAMELRIAAPMTLAQALEASTEIGGFGDVGLGTLIAAQ